MKAEAPGPSVDKVTPKSYLQLEREVGESEPLHCTSLGKILLAFLDEQDRTAILDRISLDRFTEYTITDRSAFEREIETARARGYAVDNRELALELRCIAVPIQRSDRELVSAISISGPSDRILESDIEPLLESLIATAATIGGTLDARLKT
jgi:DNA-binding IclR family transcriptional regulator